MRMFEDIMDDIYSVPTESSDKIKDDVEMTDSPLDTHYSMMMRWYLFYNIDFSNKDFIKRIKYRIESVLAATPQLSSCSRVMAAGDVRSALFVIVPDELEEDPFHHTRYTSFIFSFDFNFKNCKEVYIFLVRIFRAIKSCKIGDVQLTPAFEIMKPENGEWVPDLFYNEINSLSKKMSNKDEAFSPYTLNKIQDMFSKFINDDFDVHYTLMEMLQNEGMSQWIKFLMDKHIGYESIYSHISTDTRMHFNNEPIKISTWGSKKYELFICPPAETLKNMTTKERRHSLMSATGECVFSSLKSKLKKEISGKSHMVEKYSMWTIPGSNMIGGFMILQLKDSGACVVICTRNRYTNCAADEIWEFVKEPTEFLIER